MIALYFLLLWFALLMVIRFKLLKHIFWDKRLGLLNRKYLGAKVSHILNEWMFMVAMGMMQCTIKGN